MNCFRPCYNYFLSYLSNTLILVRPPLPCGVVGWGVAPSIIIVLVCVGCPVGAYMRYGRASGDGGQALERTYVVIADSYIMSYSWQWH